MIVFVYGGLAPVGLNISWSLGDQRFRTVDLGFRVQLNIPTASHRGSFQILVKHSLNVQHTAMQCWEEIWLKINSNKGYRIKVKLCSAFNYQHWAYLGPSEVLWFIEKMASKSVTVSEEKISCLYWVVAKSPGFCLLSIPMMVPDNHNCIVICHLVKNYLHNKEKNI